MANIGNALHGTLDISTEDVEEVPSQELAPQLLMPMEMVFCHG